MNQTEFNRLLSEMRTYTFTHSHTRHTLVLSSIVNKESKTKSSKELIRTI